MNAIILYAPSALLGTATNPHITIEAEYGADVVEGSLYTAAHHGKRSANPAPCNDRNIPLCPEGGIILVSHFDLDTLGGCLRALGMDGFFGGRLDSFWDLAEWVDVNGPQFISQVDAFEADLEYLYAFWAWSQANRLPRAEEATDITEFVRGAENALRAILSGDEGLIAEGRAFRDATAALSRESFISCLNGVISRKAAAFTNHLYEHEVDGETRMADGVVAVRTDFGSVTLSLAKPIEGVNCCELAQDLWGPEAGGHAGIAGSPRDWTYGEAQLDHEAERAWYYLSEAIKQARQGEK